MITIYVNDVPLTIPTSWNDLTFGRYVELLSAKEDDLEHAVMLLTGIPSEWWKQLYPHEAQAITELISWYNNKEAFDAAILKAELFGKTERLPEINFEMEPFEKFIICKALFDRSKKHPLYFGECILNAYCNLSAINDSVPTIYRGIEKYIFKFFEMLNKFPEFQSMKSDGKAKLAGVDRFEAFGEYATLATLSGFDPLKMREISKLPTHEVLQLKSFLSLKQSFEIDYAAIRNN
ncbi:hypothetical protein UFOVP754_4 [uncultured Caudovirales phage]|uniref:Uncharacterized protein n=1 Tax=uncultured Caudovirales phage TaxID=2100421 RepID=A0A6J7XA66_9CAUD|nr:hypothetical protein UFOVP754_4 [uncultured Caudovirales phage]